MANSISLDFYAYFWKAPTPPHGFLEAWHLVRNGESYVRVSNDSDLLFRNDMDTTLTAREFEAFKMLLSDLNIREAQGEFQQMRDDDAPLPKNVIRFDAAR